MLKKLAIGTAFLLSLSFVWAGDSAVFVDLGFSSDNSKYMFGQHGVFTDTLEAWADVFVVDIAKNTWVPKGKKSLRGKEKIVAGQDGADCLKALLLAEEELVKTHQIQIENKGELLYKSIVDEGAKEQGEKNISFRVFEDSSSFKARLVPWVGKKGKTTVSSFFIELEYQRADGKTEKYIVGSPAIKRMGVSAYRIRQVILAPDEASLVFIVEQWHENSVGPKIRYMAETIFLK